MISNEQAVSILQDIIQIKSTKRSELKVATYIQNLLYECGIMSTITQHLMAGFYVVAEIQNGTSDEILCLHSALSVKTNRNIKGSKTKESKIIDGKIYGRGISGMKSGLVALLIAFINANETRNFYGTLRLVLLIGEEIDPYELSQFSIEGYGKDLTALLVAEPSDNAIVHMHNGTLEYGIVYHGQYTYLLDFESEKTAMESLREFISFLQERLEPALELSNEILGKPTHFITYIGYSDHLNTNINYVEFKAEAKTIPEFNNKDLINLISDALDEFFSIAQGHETDFWAKKNTPAAYANPDSKLIQAIQQVSHHGNLQVQANSYPTEAGKLLSVNKGLEVAIYGPGQTNQSKFSESYISIDNYLEFIPTYADIMEGYLKVNVVSK